MTQSELQSGDDVVKSHDVLPDPATPSVDVPIVKVVLVGLIVAIVGLYVLFQTLPKSAVTLPFQDSAPAKASVNVFPQGWAFFTKSPRDEVIQVFRRDGDDLELASRTPISAPHNAFGLDRLPRKQGTEFAGLIGSAPTDQQWNNCELDLDACLSPTWPKVPVDNPSPGPTYCGDIYIVGYSATPWAWRDFGDPPRVPERSLRLEVSC
ncbi:SdpA family antimicrobial peptide system protein [Williamsia sp. 1135]|uniref:SdpA family antimicrobial peptide system protein n=1 Tax=Williamsia sp. 1135 TaxID=1889262 RepID=UPI000A1162BD|nr:SdpA family antimicrobial peptide system protein [Williamsia sp. 1135]ORM30125.1 hypothetical protein BFL43_18860 [Williamsia sp. 1135]